MKTVFCLSLLLLCGAGSTYAGVVTGKVAAAGGVPLAGVSVALLDPQDSTLATFGITGKNGVFTINDAKNGTYVLQAAMTGYYTEYARVTVVAGGNVTVNDIILQENAVAKQLGEVVVSGEKVPVRLKGDTVEYNAGSYKVKPNAPVEDLLRQLPGMQVDQDGNVKAMGKEVSKVLVDGKEFFGNDPKVATKNLPADAVSRVQTFGKHSDQSEFTGIDDGQRDQTINLVLKNDKRKGYFGDLNAGAGTSERYEGSAKVFKFRPKTQMAAIGLLNNINQPGFSFTDYMNLNGGLSSLMSGGGRFTVNAGDDLPVNFGQPVTGDITSGALGLNYSYEPRPKNRFNVSYLGNGTKKYSSNQTNIQNFLPGGSRYRTEEQEEDNSNNIAHRLSARWRNDIDSMRQFSISAKGQLKNNNATSNSMQLSYSEAALQNKLDDRSVNDGHTLDFSGAAGFVKKMKGRWRLFEIDAEGGYSRSISKSEWRNITHYFGSGAEVYNNQYQDNESAKLITALSVSATRSLGHGLYLEPKVTAGYRKELLNRDQGILSGANDRIDSLSPHFYNNIYTVTPGLSLKKSTTGNQWNLTLRGQSVTMNPGVNERSASPGTYQYLLPSVFWRKELAGHKSIGVEYSTDVNTPAANQMLPVTYYSSALSSITGNPDLRPEYQHNLNISYNHFDQFNMSSLFAYINGSYTAQKVNAARTIFPDLSQRTLWVNTPYEGRITMRGSYGQPVKKLGIDVSVDLNEGLSLAVSPVNGTDNKNTTWTHELSLRLNNKKNSVWNVKGGGSVKITDARYSLNKELNATYYNYTGFGSISYQPGKHWFFQLSADVTYYTGGSFDRPVTVPLLKAEISRYLLANQRATITLRGFDLLDKNRSVQRISQMNYLLEQRANIIGQYFMLSFNYKLNKVGKGAPGMMMINHN